MGGRLWAPTVSGPLARYAEAYERWLLARGFRPRGVAKRVGSLASAPVRAQECCFEPERFSSRLAPSAARSLCPSARSSPVGETCR
jgi:hypothetical protein